MNKIDLSIVLPVYNEVKTIGKVIDSWARYLEKFSNIKYEFMICEDGSTDGTKEAINRLTSVYRINLFSKKERIGYGSAVISGIKNSKGFYILCIDSDGQCLPENFEKFWRLKNEMHFCIGARKIRKDPLIRLIYSKIFFGLHKLLFRHRLDDPSCPYVLGPKNLFINTLPLLSFLREGFWWGFVGACVKKDIKLTQIEIKHASRLDGSSNVYKISKMPLIISRNIIGLIRLKLY